MLLRELHRDHHPRFSLRAQGGKYCNLYKANVPGLKYGSCRFWHRTDLPLGSNMHGLKSGSCRFWQRTDSPPGSNMLRRAAQTCSACKLAGVQIIPLPTLANQILARTFSDSVAHLLEMGNQCRKTTQVAHFRGSTLQCLRPSACVPSRWKVNPWKLHDRWSLRPS